MLGVYCPIIIIYWSRPGASNGFPWNLERFTGDRRIAGTRRTIGPEGMFGTAALTASSETSGISGPRSIMFITIQFIMGTSINGRIGRGRVPPLSSSESAETKQSEYGTNTQFWTTARVGIFRQAAPPAR